MLDVDIFPWLEGKRRPTKEERYRSSTIVADRLCGAVADPIVRNAQEKRQLALIERYLTERGYTLKAHPAATPLTQMEAGTFSFRLNVLVKPSNAEPKTIKIPIDAVIQPKKAKLPHLPVLIEAKSAGDFTNVNKRRKEEAIKVNYLRATHVSRWSLFYSCVGISMLRISVTKPLKESIGYGSIVLRTSRNSDSGSFHGNYCVTRNRGTPPAGTNAPR